MKGIFLGFPILRAIVDWGLCWRPFILGNYLVGVPGSSCRVIALHGNRFEHVFFLNLSPLIPI